MILQVRICLWMEYYRCLNIKQIYPIVSSLPGLLDCHFFHFLLNIDSLHDISPYNNRQPVFNLPNQNWISFSHIIPRMQETKESKVWSPGFELIPSQIWTEGCDHQIKQLSRSIFVFRPIEDGITHRYRPLHIIQL